MTKRNSSEAKLLDAYDRGNLKSISPTTAELRRRYKEAARATSKRKSELSRLKNIGPTIEKRLNEIDVYTRSDLERVGPVNAYWRICRNYPEQTIPVCYYLYSLQGALTNVHWDKVPKKTKEKLSMEAKRALPERRHARG